LSLRVAGCGPEAGPEVHRLTRLAFGGYDWLEPPSGALGESEEQVRAELAAHGGAVAWLDGLAVGCLRLSDGDEPGVLHVRRVAVDPALQRRGIGRALMEWAAEEARRRGCRELRLGVRRQLPGNLAFYRRLGYRVLRAHAHPVSGRVVWDELSLPLE
jgi:tRNA threonylcarbamoyladenosine biosynthesis protein TsaE